jgi:aspartyl-tRNA(Asn)/glutamyl-tRNA(Gln) amidotransferase subunit A
MDAIATGRLTPADLLEQVLTRIDEVEPHIRAFAHLDAAGARVVAQARTAEARRGEFRGRLHGIPVAIKDVVPVAGMPMAAGSRVLDGYVPDDDAPVVTRLREAGAIIVGKTTTHEFAYGVTTPPTRNPWDTERIAGGSSGGSAAALAAGMVPAAIGTDTGGSVRVPASLCGVYGLRPTMGAIPVEACVPFSPRMDSVGPMARTAADLALLFEVMAARRLRARRGIADLRIGVVEADALGDDTDPDVMVVVEAATRALASQGATAAPLHVPPFADWEQPRTLYVLGDFLDGHRRASWWPAARDRYGEDVRAYLAYAETVEPTLREAAVTRLHELEAEFADAIRDVDALLLPVSPVPAPEAADVDRTDENGVRRPIVGQLIRLCGPISWCGLAAASIPFGHTVTGLPVGVQIAAREVETVLDVAAMLESTVTTA